MQTPTTGRVLHKSISLVFIFPLLFFLFALQFLVLMLNSPETTLSEWLSFLAFFSVPVFFLALPRTQVRVFLDGGTCYVERSYCLWMIRTVKTHTVAEISELYLMIIENQNESVQFFGLTYKDHKGNFQELVSFIPRKEAERIGNLLRKKQEEYTQTEALPILSLSFGEYFSQVDRRLVAGAFGVLALSLGVPTMTGTFASESPYATDYVLSQQIQESLEQNVPECTGREYCVVVFFASWCSASKKTQRLVPALERYFRETGVDAAATSFTRHSMYGEPSSEDDNWQRGFQKDLGLSLAVPGFAVIHNGTTVIRRYQRGIGWGHMPYRPDAIEYFLDEQLEAPYLKKG
jgi:hypothetical protein